MLILTETSTFLLALLFLEHLFVTDFPFGISTGLRGGLLFTILLVDRSPSLVAFFCSHKKIFEEFAPYRKIAVYTHLF